MDGEPGCGSAVASHYPNVALITKGDLGAVGGNSRLDSAFDGVCVAHREKAKNGETSKGSYAKHGYLYRNLDTEISEREKIQGIL
jgi:hypothetical protein